MKSVCLSLALLVLATTLFAALPVNAQGQSVMTDEHIARIKANCQQALSSLSQTHANDAPIYINRNQTYFSVSDKLMAQLNSRLALNQLDSSQLVKLASDYSTALAKFRNVYKQYDDTMADAIKMDCQKVPVEFYDKVSDARNLRSKVHDAEVQLRSLINQYSDGVTLLQTKLTQPIGGTHD